MHHAWLSSSHLPCGEHGLPSTCLESERALLSVVKPEQRVQSRKGDEAEPLLRDALPEVRGDRIRRLLQCSVVEDVVARASWGADEHHQQECLRTEGARGIQHARSVPRGLIEPLTLLLPLLGLAHPCLPFVLESGASRKKKLGRKRAVTMVPETCAKAARRCQEGCRFTG